MKKIFFLTIALIACTASFFGCKKPSNTINNGQVIKFPFSLYFTDSSGALYNTNDGKTIKVVFPADGYPTRSLAVLRENILVLKNSLYISTNNGQNFNITHKWDSILSVNNTDVNGKKYDLNQSMMYFPETWGRVFIASANPDPANYLHIEFNEKWGVIGNWKVDSAWDTSSIVNGLANLSATSFTQTKDGYMYAYDAIHNRILYRSQLNTIWSETAIDAAAKLPSTGFFSLGHINNRLIAIDNSGYNQAYYSDDRGKHWIATSGLPANTPQLCCYSPFEELCLVGTDGQGLYLLNPNTMTFQPNNSGLGPNCVVRNIATKENIYKNDTHEQFVFLATNLGLYISYDKGNNWIKTYPGNFINIY